MTRIIAGRAGSLRIEVPKSGTRPTTDRVREAIFSALEAWDALQGARVLDLYAGSGALGLEAASRGAASVTMVEKHPQSAQITQRNVSTITHAWSGSADAPTFTVERTSAQTYLERFADAQPLWDVVLIDPPYDLSEEELTANLVSLAPLLAPRALVLVERSTRSPEPTVPESLAAVREKKYGETALWWYEPA